MSQDVWNPDRYLRFRRERSQPFYDLLALVQRRPAMRIVDLGCGTGALTRQLHRTLQARETIGIDSSEAMLAKAVTAPGLHFERHDIGSWDPSTRFDLIFSNAALHWVGPDHATLLRHLTQALAPGGQLAVQVPANQDHPSHTVAAEIAATAPFADALDGDTRPAQTVLPPERYATLLAALGYHAQHVRLQVYGHWLGETADVARWVEGTLLTDYERRLPKPLFARFRERYRDLLLERLGDTQPFFFPFKRILIWGALGA